MAKNEERKSPISFILERLLGIFGEDLVSVVLFGSRARKNYTENSDLDIMVVVEKETESEEIKDLRIDFLLNFSKNLDIHIFTKEDAESNFQNFTPLFSSILLGNKVLFDKDMFFTELLKKFVKEMAKEDIKYCEGGKIWHLKKVAKNLENLQ